MDVDASAKMEYRGDSSVVNIRGRTLDILYGKNTGFFLAHVLIDGFLAYKRGE